MEREFRHESGPPGEENAEKSRACGFLENLTNYFLPPGPILSVTLIGLILLGAVLYNRAVRMQRFLEPALAISQPRVVFYEGFRRKFVQEFGPARVEGVMLLGDSVRVRNSLVFDEVYHGKDSGVLGKLGRVFLAMMRDPDLSGYVDIILVGTKVPMGEDKALNARVRHEFNKVADAVLDTLFREVPQLEDEYAIHFASSALHVNIKGGEADWVEFYIIPSERIHVELLQKLQKYVR
jgi:hypothetical protein